MTFIDAKLRDYEQALIRQYNAQGYAEDETEITDSEEEDATVVEN
jgi:outer membrane protein assembly factor BamA